MSEARINLPAKIFPTGNFETHEDIYGKGGFVVLNDQIGASAADDFINERITYQRRKEGMLVYVSSNSSYYRCTVTGSSESEGEWTKQYFAGRYFHGATAPTASDIQLGEKWFDTVVGTEYTYIPIADGSTYLAWVDIDHIGKDTTADTANFITRTEAEDLYVNVSGDTMNGTLTGTNASFTGLTATNGFIGTLTGTNASFTGLTATNGFIGTLTADRAFRQSDAEFTDNEFITKSHEDSVLLGYVKKSGDIMSGTLTGTDASFSNSITSPNGFIGTLTGNNIRYTNAEFGAESLVIQGSSATFTNMSVMLTGDSTFNINDLSIGTTFDAENGQNRSVYRIFADDGVALGGNDLLKNNWLGNNVYLAPSDEHSVLIGLPLSREASNHEKLTMTGGIVTKRIFATGTLYPGLTSLSDGKAFNTLAYSLAAGITTVDGYETPLFSVQERQPGGGWVNAPKIRRVWPTGERNSTARTDPVFEDDEYITKQHFENNTRSETGSVYIQFSITLNSTNGAILNNWIRDIPTMNGDGNSNTANNVGNSHISMYIGSRDVPFPKPWKVTVLRHYYPTRSSGAVSILSSPNLPQTHAAKNACMKNSFVVGEGEYLGVEQRVYAGAAGAGGASEFFGTNNSAGLDNATPTGLSSISNNSWKRIKCAAHRVGSYAIPQYGTYYTEIYIVPVEQ